MLLYITADKIGIQTGGGAVTFHESEALKNLGPCNVIDRSTMEAAAGEDPWKWDDFVSGAFLFDEQFRNPNNLAHFYAGSFSKTVGALRENFGYKITYTAAAHDVRIS